MKNQQSGFTLIELIAVIVILGILAAVAVPRFVDLSDAAEEAAVEGVAGGLGSAAALNHANNIADDAGLTTTTALTSVANCQDVANLLDPALDANKYTIASLAITPEGASETCTVTSVNDNTKSAEFVGYAVTP